jgi:transposase
MSRLLKARKPNGRELRRLCQILEEPERGRCHPRAEALILHAAGLNGLDMARALEVHPNTIYAYLHGFEQRGLAFVQECPRRGLPAGLSATQFEEIARIADQSPGDFGLPYGRWSLGKLREYLLGQGRFFEAISLEHLRRLLKKKTSASATSSASSSAGTRNAGRSWPVSARSGATCPAGA